jgi:hypothetical protein
LTDEQRQRLERYYRERLAQAPKGSLVWNLLDHILLRLRLGETPREIHKINRGRASVTGRVKE